MNIEYAIYEEIAFIIDLLKDNKFINESETKNNNERIKSKIAQSPKGYWGIHYNNPQESRIPLELKFVNIDAGKESIPFYIKHKLNNDKFFINLEMKIDFYGKKISGNELNDPFDKYQLNFDFFGYRKDVSIDKLYASWRLDKHIRKNKVFLQDIEKLRKSKSEILSKDTIDRFLKAIDEFNRDGRFDHIPHLEYRSLVLKKEIDPAIFSEIFRIIESDDFTHPEYHFHFGGKYLRDNWDKTGNIIVIDSPRIMHYPMDFPLAVHFILTNFYSRDRRQRLVNNPTYIKIIKNAKERVLRPYFSSIVNNWDSNPENPFHFSYITGIK